MDDSTQDRPAHTPGPWRATTTHGIDDSEPFQVWCDDIGAAVAHVYRRSECRDGRGLGEQAANAGLIAAAPELLEALERLLANAEAIHSYGLRDDVPPLTAVCFCDAQTAARAAIAKATPAR